MAAKNELIVEVTRGDMVESRHRGACAVVNVAGDTVHAWGDTDRIIYPRSAIKPLQTLVLIETGAADAYRVSDAELALATASHGATPEHVGLVAGWLERIGLGPGNLECGGHEPMDKDAAKALARAGEAPGPLHNNCSGKHVGFLTTAIHRGEPTKGYSKPGHPVQDRLFAMLSEMGGADLTSAPTGTDGCGIPVIGMPLSSLALALARMADPKDLEEDRADAANRILAAMTQNPRLVAGPKRFDTVAMEAGQKFAGGTFVVKAGAEGVYGAILPALGLGVALKIDDGAKRAAEVAMAAVLDHLGVLDEAAKKAMAAFLQAEVTNAKGDAVGTMRMTPGWTD
jgi:L-asparaginase II